MVKNLLRRRSARAEDEAMRLDAARGRILIEESGEILVVLDESERVVLASRRARAAVDGLEVGELVPEELVRPDHRPPPILTPYELNGRRELLLRLPEPDLSAYEELRSGFTAVVSHELRTPLARLLALLETALLPDTDQSALVEQARLEVEQIRELIDEVLFLSELESGTRVVVLGAVPVRPELEAVVAELEERAGRAGVALVVEGDRSIELAMRPRMIRVVAQNLAANAIRYAGPGATFTLAVRREDGTIVLRGTDDGVGVEEAQLPRLFERFFRADRARASRGTGLGLAIVKHIVTQADGMVEARGGFGAGLEIRCTFPGG
jgi:two-component system phosphate regulon sensor histidine kinase PhoR